MFRISIAGLQFKSFIILILYRFSLDYVITMSMQYQVCALSYLHQHIGTTTRGVNRVFEDFIIFIACMALCWCLPHFNRGINILFRIYHWYIQRKRICSTFFKSSGGVCPLFPYAGHASDNFEPNFPILLTTDRYMYNKSE